MTQKKLPKVYIKRINWEMMFYSIILMVIGVGLIIYVFYFGEPKTEHLIPYFIQGIVGIILLAIAIVLFEENAFNEYELYGRKL